MFFEQLLLTLVGDCSSCVPEIGMCVCVCVCVGGGGGFAPCSLWPAFVVLTLADILPTSALLFSVCINAV